MKNESEKKLTWRQSQTLLSLYWHKKTYGKCTFSDPIGDMGISYITLADHLDSLYKNGLVNYRDGVARNLGPEEEIEITSKGVEVAENICLKLNVNTNFSPQQIQRVVLKDSQDAPENYNIRGARRDTKFNKAMNEMIRKNPIEPIMTSIAMYTELDTQLDEWYITNQKMYTTLARAKLNLEIRNGRLASIAIPIALQGALPIQNLSRILSDSWGWVSITGGRSFYRYINESICLGIVEKSGNSLVGTNPSTESTVSWLANKTAGTFLNTFSEAPKACLLVFRETWNHPTLNDLLYPTESSLDLQWARKIYESTDKSDYKKIIMDALKVLKDDSRIITLFEDRLLPTTIYDI